MKLERYKEEMFTYDIIGNSELSDTIVCYMKNNNPMFLNICGGESRNMKDVIRAGKKYIVIDTRGYDGNRNGWLAKYFPESGILLAAFFYLKHSKTDDNFFWEEKYRVIVNWEDFLIFKNGKVIHDYDMIEGTENYIDLCGQFVYDTDSKFECLDMPKGFHINGTSGEASRQLFGSCFWTFGNCYTSQYTCDLYELLEARDIEVASLGIRRRGMESISVGDLIIPDNITELLGRFAKRTLRHFFDTCVITESTVKDFFERFFEGFNACILENCNGKYVLRVFIVYPNGNDETGSGIMPINYVEIGRIHIEKRILDDMSLACYPLLYFDRNGIEDGIFKYCIKYLEEAENSVKYIIEKRCCSFDMPGVIETVVFSLSMALCPFFEKLYNLFKCSSNINANMLKESVRCCTCLKILLRRRIGDFDENEAELHKALGISKPILLLLKEGKCTISNIVVMKKIFEKDMLMEMDKESALLIIDFLNSCEETALFTCYTKCLSDMIYLFGLNNYKGYMKFLKKEYGKLSLIENYKAYINKVDVIKTFMPDLKLRWKIKSKDLENEDAVITSIYTEINDKNNYSDVCDKFKGYFSEWKNYEYCNDKFFITYPKGPTELIEEGVKLNHCAKTFIHAVADGDTTILFIREREKPNKPYYTIELKDGSIRQCHGFNNCSASENPKLMDFIQKFCEDKNLKISETFNDRLGVM